MNERMEIEQRIGRAATDLASAGQKATGLSWARLTYFAVAIVALLGTRAAPAAVVAAIIPFGILVWMHRRASAEAERARSALAAARGSLARMDRDWPNIPPPQSIPLGGLPNRAAIADLDLYGERSVFRLLDVSQPGLGGSLVLRWLLDDPAPQPVIEARQASVAQLRARPDFLLECARLSRHRARPGPSDAKLMAFRRWCEAPGDPFSRKLVWIARLLTATFVGVVALILANRMLLQPLASTVTMLLAGQMAVAGLARRYLRDRLRESADLLAELTGVVDVLRLATTTPGVAGRFGEIQTQLIDTGAAAAFARLSRLFAWDSAHHSPMLLAALDTVVAFDAHLAPQIDDWARTFGPRVPEWLDLVAEAQALAALATLACENPDWTMPRVHDDPCPVLVATDCGHPLIAASRRVTNPVSIDGEGSAIVVSGSNMSGKTTYLRAVGVNALLAFAGGPVCASAFSVRRCRVRTTVRIEDDLGAGVSLFMAEVTRIAEIVTDAGRSEGPPVLFLFDEILHGTNARDRREATQLVLRRLLAGGAAGVITTHDPRIADVEKAAITGNVSPMHFTDAVESRDGRVVMTFDYILRPGPATTTNALRILEALDLR